MSERKRQRVEENARRLELCASNLRDLSASIGSYQFRTSSMNVSVPLQAPKSVSKPRNQLSQSTSRPSSSLYSFVSSAAYAAKTNAANGQDTWQTTLHRLALELTEETSSKDAIDRCERLNRRYEALSGSIRLVQEQMKATGDEVALQERVERQLAQDETAWEQQMQTREQRVAEREVELQTIKEEEPQEQEQEEEEQVDLTELHEAAALRVEEKRDLEAAIESLQRKKMRRKRETQTDDVKDAATTAREQVLRELREEKETLQRQIIATEETEEQLDENVRHLPALKDELAQSKKNRAEVQTTADALRLELNRQKRKMRHMVDVQLLTARDTNPPTLREEAVLLHLLYEHEGEMGVNELKQEASDVLKDHGKPNGNGVVIRALYSLVAIGIVQIDRSYGNGLVTSLLV
ncbi:Translation initiation factor eIF-3 subunit 10 [Phytophthora megakarya]|uniref:Translation initiation factor eIF-3 subunit 10 n=1 Tax=Phytophthora megakarya TaxID=4795 RepID=A0A225VP88_9STRA|nr:Translation initiation factor eIF-3 subunit 10 [Phytophthora megakarya]